jgi:hypothetical protein
MKKLIALLMVVAAGVLFTGGCGGAKPGQTGLPSGVMSDRELAEMKRHPEDFTKKQLEAAGLDPTPGRDEDDTAPAAGQ